MPKGVYERTEAMKEQCRINARKSTGFRGPHSEATKELMRQAKLKNPTRYWLGRTDKPAHSKETIQQMRETHAALGTTFSPLARELARQARLGSTHSPATRAKIRAAFTPAVRARLSEQKKVFNPGATTNYPGKRSGIELRVEKFLTIIGVPFFPQFQIGQYFCDFLVPVWNTVIECDGTYWHSPTVEKRHPGMLEHGRRREEFILQQGVEVLHLPESVIKDPEVLLSTMQEFVNNRS
jgi:very-short-patch-repair endonuclease